MRWMTWRASCGRPWPYLRLADAREGGGRASEQHAVAALAQRAPRAVRVADEAQGLALLGLDPLHVAAATDADEKVREQQHILRAERGEPALQRRYRREKVLLHQGAQLQIESEPLEQFIIFT